jgi:hypothetical protein
MHLLRKVDSGKRWLIMASMCTALLAACGGGPSQKEMSLLAEHTQAAESAEKTAMAKKAEKASLEAVVAKQKAAKSALESKKAETLQNLSDMSAE